LNRLACRTFFELIPKRFEGEQGETIYVGGDETFLALLGRSLGLNDRDLPFLEGRYKRGRIFEESGQLLEA
jgi:hypothetical protein